MNRSQIIAVAVGLVWAVVTVMLPPVLVPAVAAAKAYVELSRWNSAGVHEHGVDIPYLVGELVAIGALTVGLIYCLKTQPARAPRRRE